MYSRIFSIIIPTFNSDRTLKETLESILKQSCTDFEILLIDGKSEDNTLNIAKGFNDSRISVVSEHDQGIYDAMNKGIGLAAGSWLYFLGSDDRLANDHVLEKVAGHLATSTADVVYGDVLLSGDSFWGKDRSVYDGPFTLAKLFNRNICHQAVFYSEKIFRRIGYYNLQYPVCADWDMNHRCFAFARTEYIGEIIAVFAAGGKSSQVSSDRFLLEDSVVKLKEYHRISYTNTLFKDYAKVFFRNAERKLEEKRIFRSLYFLFFAIWHAKRAIPLLKKYGGLLRNYFKRANNN